MFIYVTSFLSIPCLSNSEHWSQEEEIYHRDQYEQEGIQTTRVMQYMEAPLRGPDENL